MFSMQTCKVVYDALRCIAELMSKVMVSKAAGVAAALYSIMVMQVSQGMQSQLKQCILLDWLQYYTSGFGHRTIDWSPSAQLTALRVITHTCLLTMV